MARFRCTKGIATANRLTGTISNPKVPLAYKQMLLNSLLMPTLLYGSEIFGMNETRLQNLTRVENNSMKNLVKKHNFCRIRLYRELDIKHPAIYAAANRARCFIKMKDSNGIISDLIRSTGAFKSKKKTWCTSTVTWLRKNRIPLDMSIKETTRRVKAAISARKVQKDKSIIGATANKYGIGSGKELRMAELDPQTSTLGIATLFRLRTGTFRTINEMVVTGKLSPIYKDRCILCNLEVKETVEHMILDCEALIDERTGYLSSIINEINS